MCAAETIWILEAPPGTESPIDEARAVLTRAAGVPAPQAFEVRPLDLVGLQLLSIRIPAGALPEPAARAALVAAGFTITENLPTRAVVAPAEPGNRRKE